MRVPVSINFLFLLTMNQICMSLHFKFKKIVVKIKNNDNAGTLDSIIHLLRMLNFVQHLTICF